MRPSLYKAFLSFLASAVCVVLAGCPGFFTPRTNTTTPPGATPKFAFVSNFQNGTAGSISIFTLDPTTGALTTAGTPVSTGATSITNGPTSLVTVLGKYLYSANDGGTVSAFSINTTSGALSAIAGSPYLAGTNPNAVLADPAGKFLYVANSGSRDISAFQITSSTGTLVPIATFVAGSSSATAGQAVGLAVHPTGKFLYVAEDTAGIAVFSINSTSGTLTFVSTILPQSGGAIQSLAIEKTGSFIYATDGASGVEEFSINASTGSLTLLAGSPATSGNVPIVLTADPAGSHVYVANQTSDNVFSYGVLNTGELSLLSGGTVAAGASPSSIAIDPSGKFVYVTNLNGGPDISVYSIDSSGKLVVASTMSTGVTTAMSSSIAFL